MNILILSRFTPEVFYNRPLIGFKVAVSLLLLCFNIYISRPHELNMSIYLFHI
nr:MAG TPA: hypothetical protein [Caudoviricetes sp.]